MIPQVFVDLDGVLGNLNKSMCQSFGIVYPKATTLSYDWVLTASQVGLDEFFRVLESNPEIWDRVEPFPWTPKLVQCLDLHAPNWKILSEAIIDPACWHGKVKWVRNFLSQSHVHRLALTGFKKYELACPGDILIDDRELNVEEWVRRGGHAFRWMDYTEDLVDSAEGQIISLSAFLEDHLKRH